ncbi:virginiamycin B lyase family protein [Pseudomonas panipatensis]|uniref:Virginiamycin B lyase n=2 Tax=Pseudomonas panipatensis TaxID=428992 RepID=A0A1G8JB12_9PSED|nr:SMP-30/gluconolactonase/LRE family protein [Pseudomonas panipatensis]SDI28468.1 virginiamycin B lyase [Pseudomonas panipatensis]SMP50580.1 virginiamycin B lyase [Pseudomonas panipatensis]
MPLSPRLTPALLCALLFCTASHAADLQYYPLAKGAAPQAVVPADDGKVWFSATGNGSAGRLDPQSGEAEQINLGKGSVPHGLVIGAEGNVWVADSGLNALVRIDGERLGTENFPLPAEAANAGLDALVQDDDGVLWFTGENGFYGRFDPASHAYKVWPAPDGKGPHGLAVTPDGSLWYAASESNRIVQIDSLSGATTSYDTPGANGKPLQLGADSVGRLWISQPGNGQLSRFDPSDRTWKSWPLPGDQPQPQALYVDRMDRVWLSDAAGNLILRFDAQTERFHAYPSDQPAAQVRQINGRPGETWAAESGNDRLAVIRE